MTKNIRTWDKLQEAKHFLGQMQEEIRLYFDERDPNTINRFRYTFSAFVPAARSVTFVLQNQYRSEYKDEFEVWYAEKKEELKQFPFAGLFLELRNIGIHQGNRLPIFQFEFTSRAGSIYQITWSPEYHEVIEYGVKISDKDQELVETKAAPNISEEEFVDLFLQELIDISKVVFSKDAINSWKKNFGVIDFR